MLAIHQMRSGSSHITTRPWQQAGLAHPHWMASSKLVWLLDVWMDRIEVSSSCVITLNKGFSLRILYTVQWILAMGLVDLLGIADLHCRKVESHNG